MAATNAGGAIGDTATDGVTLFARHRHRGDSEECACGRLEEGTRKCGGPDGLSAKLERRKQKEDEAPSWSHRQSW